MIQKIDIKEVEQNLPSGTPVKVRGLDSGGNGIVCDPKSLSSLRKIEYGESVPNNGDYVSWSGLGAFSTDKNGDCGGFQIRFNDDSDGNPIFQVRVFINITSTWSDWKSVTLI